MNMQGYVDEIKLALTGGILECELTDEIIQKAVNASLREIQRYICSTKIITVPYQKVIDLKDYKVNAVTKVLRADAAGMSTNSATDVGVTDPVAIGLWQMTTGNGLYNFSTYASRLASWNTLQQVENTMSTDLAFYYEDSEKKLYINTTLGTGQDITIEYVPRYDNVDEVTSDFWIDVIMRMAKATCKIYLGRIRGRFTQTNALWTQDAETMLNEGTTELSELRNYLQANTQLIYCYD